MKMNNVVYYAYYWLLKGYSLTNLVVEDVGYSPPSLRAYHFVPAVDNKTLFTLQGYIDAML